MNLLLFQNDVSVSPLALIAVGIAIAGFFLTLLGVIVAFVRWGISLEAKNARSAEKIERLEKDDADHREKLQTHMLNNSIHFSHDYARQVEAKQNQRFEHIEGQLSAIKGELGNIDKKLDDVIKTQNQ